MKSYIFDNKTKNIIAAIAAILCMLMNLWNAVDFVISYRFVNLFQAVALLPHLCILIYLVTLKHNYGLKKFLFPSAFLTTFVLSVCQFISNYAYIFKMNLLSEISNAELLLLINSVFMALIDCVLFLSYALCFVGSIANFKLLKFFKAGAIIRVVAFVTIIAVEIFTVVIGGIEAYNEGGQLIISYEAFAERIISLFFGVSLLLLAFNKKKVQESKVQLQENNL